MNDELNDNKIFEFDVEKSKQRRRKVYIRRMCIFPFFMGLLYFLMPVDMFELFGSLGKIVIYSFIIFFIIVMEIIFFYFLKRNPFGIKKMTLELLEDKLLVIRDKTKEEIIYSDITKYKVYKTKENEIKYIDLITNKDIIRIWHFIKMDELYLQLREKFENKQEQVITTFNKVIQSLRAVIIILLLIIPLFFVFRYYKYNISLSNCIIYFYLGLIYVFYRRKIFRAIEYPSSFTWDPALYKYFGITFLILSLGMLIMYILTTKF